MDGFHKISFKGRGSESGRKFFAGCGQYSFLRGIPEDVSRESLDSNLEDDVFENLEYKSEETWIRNIQKC